MEMNYQKDILKYVSEKQLEKRNAIIEKWNETGVISRTNGNFLVDFDKKARICNNCGKTFKETKGWRIVKSHDRSGNNVDCGLSHYCFDCEMKEILREGNMGLLG